MKKLYLTSKWLLPIFAIAMLTACSDDDSGSTTPTNGDVSFWNNDDSIGIITVNVNSASAQITHNIHPDGCGESGCANFNLPPGTYNFTASATTGETWNSSCTVEAGGCLRFNLY